MPANSIVEVVHEGSALTVSDLAGHTLRVDVDGWHALDQVHDLDRRVDVTTSGLAHKISLACGCVTVSVLDGPTTISGDVATLASDGHAVQDGDQFTLDRGTYRIRAEGDFSLFLRVDGPLTVSLKGDVLTVSFPTPSAVTFGFRSRIERPRETITVPRTPSGLATALSHFSAGLHSITPDRSFPSLRGHPPAVEFGESTHVPMPVCDRTPDTGIDLVVPPRYDALFPVAPLAFYLGANVRLAEQDVARIRAPGLDEPLGSGSTIQYHVAALLRRVFSLDCLVRNAGPHGSDLAELDALDTIDFDLHACYEASSAERLRMYLDVDFAAVTDAFPAWRSVVYADPTPEMVPSLPSVVNDLSAVFTPDAYGVPAADEVTGATTTPTWQRLDGWLSAKSDHPEDTYAVTPSAHRNRAADLGLPGGDVSVTVVTNPGADPAHADRLAAAYRARLDGTAVTRETNLSQGELADSLATEIDLFHFVGGCDGTRLQCTDGWLDVPGTVHARIGILDAPASDEAARALVDGGAIGAVGSWGEDVVDPTGTLGSLCTCGFTVEAARRVAARVGTVSSEVRVVGDGAFRLGAAGTPRFLIDLDDTGDDLSSRTTSFTVSPGAVYVVDDYRPRLPGNETSGCFDVQELRHLEFASPFVYCYDGTLYFPDEVERLIYPAV